MGLLTFKRMLIWMNLGSGILTGVAAVLLVMLCSGCETTGGGNAPKELRPPVAAPPLGAGAPLSSQYGVASETDEKSGEAEPPRESVPSRTTPSARASQPAKVLSISGNRYDQKAPTQARQVPIPPITAAPQKEKKPAGDQGIVMNFEGADLYDVVKVLADELGVNYFVAPGVKGTVTIHTAGEISRQSLRQVLDNVLQLQGLAAVPNPDGTIGILPLKDAARQPGVSVQKGSGLLTSGMAILIVPLKHVGSGELVKLLEPFLSPGAGAIEVPSQNMLIINDLAANLERIADLVATVDQSALKGVDLEIWRLQNAPVEQVAAELQSVLESYGYGKKDATVRTGYRLLPIRRLNSLVFMAADQKLIQLARQMLGALDQVRPSAERKLYVYPVRNGTAEDLAKILGEIFAKKEASPAAEKAAQERTAEQEKQAQDERTVNPFYNIQKQEPSFTAPKSGTVLSALEGELKIVPDQTRNLLVIQATPRDYEEIRKLLNELDILPRQVLLEVLVVEVILSKSLKLGVEWKYLFDTYGATNTVSLTTNLANNIASGFLYSVAKADKIQAAVAALAEENAVKVIASPHVLASDNKEASITVSQEVPVVTGSVSTGLQATVVTQNVQYRDTGVLLNVTPHINNLGLVTMDVSQEISDLSDKTIQGITNPIFNKRKAKTRLSVQNGQTIVIGGMIREQNKKADTGIPGLKRIPLFNLLFKRIGDEDERTELMIFITPHVVTDTREIDEVTMWFRQHVAGGFQQGGY